MTPPVLIITLWPLGFLASLALALAAYPVYRLLSIARSGQLRNPQSIWQALGGIAIIRYFRSYSMTFLVARLNPFSSTISYTILDINQGHASAILKDQKRIRNPFKSVHAAAIILFAETLAGLAVLTTIGDLTKERCILTTISAVYFKKGRGLLTGTATFQKQKEGESGGSSMTEEQTRDKTTNRRDSKAVEQVCTVVIKDSDLVTIAKVWTYWTFGKINDKKTS